jgi:hypothetical protein
MKPITGALKPLLSTSRDVPRHWVGDGFPVRSLMSWHTHGAEISPFLLLDHAGPADFAPATTPRGVGWHPHRGFETVTLVYAGEVAHRDSSGNAGVIGPGDLQWMTAGRGVLHEEMHSEQFTAAGGRLEMVQLWVNLPAREKMRAPGYQSIGSAQVPSVPLPGGGSVRVIAGAFQGQTGPAQTVTPVLMWDLTLPAGSPVTLTLPAQHSAMLLTREGTVEVRTGADAIPVIATGQLAIFGEAGDTLVLEATEGARALLIGGEPLREPVVGYGPFVMNTQAEIEQAFADFRANRF